LRSYVTGLVTNTAFHDLFTTRITYEKYSKKLTRVNSVTSSVHITIFRYSHAGSRRAVVILPLGCLAITLITTLHSRGVKHSYIRNLQVWSLVDVMV